MGADAEPETARSADRAVAAERATARGWRPWPRSLKGRLIASHALTLLLALGLVLVIAAGFLRRQEGLAQVEQLEDLAVPLTVQAGFMSRRLGALAGGERLVEEVLTNQAAAMGVRLLLLDAVGMVRFDSGGAGADPAPLVGQRLGAYAGAVDDLLRTGERREVGAVSRVAPEAALGEPDPLAGTRLVLASDRLWPPVVVAVAAAPRPRPLVARFIPPLLVALGISLAMAAAAGSWSSRRIASPVSRLTVAADAMAGGALEQRVAGEGEDEVGRLVASFNAMSGRVAATAASQRRLLADVAHELRTPLTAVRGYAQAVRDGVAAAPADRERASAAIVAEAERMGRLVGELLDLSRLESGQVVMAFEAVAVGPALEQAATRFGPAAAAKGVRVAVVVDPGAAGLLVRADEGRLAQILGNLAGNAVRHTGVGGAVVLSAEAGPEPGSASATVRLRVRDTGEGIAPEARDRLFERFARGGDAAGTGFGLGLAIVRELVAAQGGTIAVTSEVGVGTTVEVDLPAASGPWAGNGRVVPAAKAGGARRDAVR